MKPAVMAKACLLTAIVFQLVTVIQGNNECSEPCLIYSAGSKINAIELNTSKIVTVVSNLQRAAALDVHVNEKTIYWSDINLRVITRLNMSSGKMEDLITEDLGTVYGLAVEWESHVMYWSDYSNGRIEVAFLDGSQRKLLFMEGVNGPRGIALHPKKGWMFWADWGHPPRIERSSLAGVNRTTLVDLSSSSQYWPNAVFVDYTEDRVYWIDAYRDVIDSTDLNGQNRQLLSWDIHPWFNMNPFDFTVYGDTLYWSDWNTDSIERLNWTSADYTGGLVSLKSDQPYGIALLDQSRQPSYAGHQQCRVNNGDCSHLCLLTPDGFSCACPDGLPMLSDRKNCQTDLTKFLLFAEGSSLRQLLLNSTTPFTVPITKEYISSPIALDYNFIDRKVYWTDFYPGTISRAFLNGSNQETIVSTRLRTPYGLAVDSYGQNMYWTDSSERVIEVASLNGPYRRVLVIGNLRGPRDVVLDVTRGFMFWTDWTYWNYDSKIEKADMDGGNRTVVVQFGIDNRFSFPSGLALDVTKNWLYWVDSYNDKLEVYEFSSNKRREIISAHQEAYLSYPFRLALHENHLFWTDWRWRYYGVYRVDRNTGLNAQKILSSQSRPMSIRAYDREIDLISVTDQCNYDNGGCSQLCLLTPLGSKCSCSDELDLRDDGQTCHVSPQFLLFADYTNGKIMKVTPQNPGSVSPLPLSNLNHPVSLAYDDVEHRVYWIDAASRTISRSFLNGSSQEVIINTLLGYPNGLAVDFVGRNLYWADRGSNKLEVSKLDGSYRTALVTSDLSEPRDIILDANKGMMYWTSGSYYSSRIEKAEMTGKERVVLLSSYWNFYPNGLTLDHGQNRLYWVDRRYHKLEYLDLNLNIIVNLIRSYDLLRYPFGLALLGDHLYWTDLQLGTVYRANKTGGSVTKFVVNIGQPRDIQGYNVSEHATPVRHPCQLNNSGCSHLCLISSTGSKCVCPNHLTLRENGRTCYDFQKFLLFAEGSKSEIFIFPLDGSSPEAKPLPIELDMGRPVALDLDITENRIYWTDTYLNTISRVFINGSSPEIIVSEDVDSSYGLAIDPLGRNIYWTDIDSNKIEVCRMDGTMRKTLIHQDLDNPMDIILDLRKGLMYWCDVGVTHKIEVANMDGDDRHVLVRRGLHHPNGLTLDDTNNRLYWVDSSLDTLEYYDLERHTITTLLDRNYALSHPFGLTSIDAHLYWTDWSRDAVYQGDKETASNRTVLVSGLSQPMDIHAYDRNQTLPDHPCSLSYGGCSHLCLLRPEGYRCSCPDKLSLSKDGKTCVNSSDFQKFILFADGYDSQAGIFVVSLDGSYPKPTPVPLQLDMDRPVALDLDITENRIYWTDPYLNTISRVFINGSSPEIIVSEDVYNSYGLAVDPLGRNIYWTDLASNKIEVSRMDGTMRKTLIHQDLDNPMDIILHLEKGLMYWCNVGIDHKIEVANMDGDDRRVLVRRGLYYPKGLTLDDKNDRLYWVDSSLHILEYFDLQRHTITTLLNHGSILSSPFGLTSLDNYLYWTNQYAVYRADKKTASNSEILVGGLDGPKDIHAYDRNKTLPDHPCSSSYGGCSHLCLLRPNGGYRCSCPDGFNLLDDRKTCNHSHDLQKFILFADGYYGRSGIFILSLDGSNSEANPVPIELDMDQPVALDLDMKENRIYWTDTYLNTISRVFINGSSPEVIVSDNVHDSNGLAVDPLGRNIYWTDTYANTIEVCRMDGTMRKTLIHHDLDYPSDIILDLRKGLMYWCSRGVHHKIEVANMDGYDRTVLVRRGLHYPNGLTLDDKNNRLYWVDSSFETLEYYDLQRHTITTLLDRVSILSHSFGLTSLDDYLYWTDRYRDAVYQADKRTALNSKILVSGLIQPSDIHAYDRNKTLPDHPCSSYNGVCTHLCLLRPDGYICSCPDNLQSGEVCLSSAVVLPSSSTPVKTGSQSNQRSQSVDVISSSSVLSMTLPSVSVSSLHMETPLFSTLPCTIFKTLIISSTAQSLASNYSKNSLIEQKTATISSTLPSSSIKIPALSSSKSIPVKTGSNSNHRSQSVDVISSSSVPSLTLPSVSASSPHMETPLSSTLPFTNSNHRSQSVDVISSSSVLSMTLPSVSTSSPHMETPLSSTLPCTIFKTLIISSTAQSLACNCSKYSITEQKTATISSTLPSSSIKIPVLSSSKSTPVKTRSNSNHRSQSVDVKSSSSVLSMTLPSVSASSPHMETPLSSTLPFTIFKTLIISSTAQSLASNYSKYSLIEQNTTTISSTLPSSSIKTKALSSSKSSSINHIPTQSGQQTTAPSACEPPTSTSTTACLADSCKNGGTCVLPGNFCKCEKVFTWHDCSVYVGSSTVEMELVVLEGSQWNLLDFKIAIATACSQFLCEDGDCTSKSRSGRVKRSEGGKYFQPSDIVISGVSSGGENTWIVEFSALFPAVNGQAPQPIPDEYIVQMMNESKGTIEKAFGGKINRITAGPIPRPTTVPDKQNEGAKLTQGDDKTSIWIAAGVGGLVVLVIIMVAFGIYRIRRCSKSDPRKRQTDSPDNNIRNAEFGNPAFDEDNIYDSVSKARGSSVAASLSQANERGLQKCHSQTDRRNEMMNKAPCEYNNGTYQALDKTAVCSPAYRVPQSGGHGIENSEKPYASLHQKNKQQNKEYPGRGRRMENPAKQYASLQQKTGHPRQSGHDAMNPGHFHFQTKTRQHASDAATDDEFYENLQIQDESGA